MTTKPFSGRARGLTDPAHALTPVIPADDAPLPEGMTRGLFVGVGGTLALRDARGAIVEIVSADCQYHPIRVAEVRATGTTASGIVALY